MRMYRMFDTKEHREAWIKEQEREYPDFRICFRCSAEQLKQDLPFISIKGFKSAVVYTFD